MIPWPISDLPRISVTRLSGVIRTQASYGLGGFFSCSAACPAKARPDIRKPTNNAVKKGWSVELGLAGFEGSGVVDGFADALVRAAAADVSAHGIVNIRIGWVGFLRQQRRRGHDLPGLAVSALRHVFFDPGLLHRMRRIHRKPFNRGDFLSGTARDRRDARARCLSVDVHRARAAKRHPAPELRARHVQRVPQHPEQRHLRIDINSCGLPIQRKSCAHVLLPQLANYPTTPRHRMEITENPPTSRLLALALWQQFLKCRDALLRAG